MKKSISIFLLATILLQSCVAYQKTSVSLNEAQNQGKIKVATTYGTLMEFKNIYQKDSIYYGVAGTQEIRLDTTQVSAVYLQDIQESKKQTRIVWVSVGIGTLLFVITMVVLAYTVGY